MYSQKSFIEDRTHASYFDWLFSKGTNYTCYLEYENILKNNHEQELNNIIDIVRTIIYALSQPFQFTFFYWTLLIFLMHKFNFKKPIMKILLAHYLLRCTGHIIDNFGGLMNHYYSNEPVYDSKGNIISYKCRYDSSSTEMHPLKWLLTRQICTIFWFSGEIIADWYPLLRTKAVIQKQKSIRYVYASCGFFNLSKISLMVYHFMLSPTELYDKNGAYDKERVSNFYNTYWIIQLIIIYASVIYDFTVFMVLKNNVFKINKSEFGFMKKFRNISEFRILVSAIISAVFLPIVSFTIIMKFYCNHKYNYYNLDFSFDAIRQLIANGQYFMIFIDQILLLRSSEETSRERSTTKSSHLGNNRSNFMRSINNDKTYYSITDFNNTNNIFDSISRKKTEKQSLSKFSPSNTTSIDSPTIAIDYNSPVDNNLLALSPKANTSPIVVGSLGGFSNVYNKFNENSNIPSNNNNNIINYNTSSNVSNINTNYNSNGWYY
ncbi:hypothetical protein BCR36DRAFT_353280 [Piromyces finnis]|uniref:Uncharacterized protein n=1 Tax=Piromyces finnis TaxID=1754191 RepID=A0A1Y1V8F0_9FUNG|nr:hypothetical protein BCR36DRAFT_353280 [Piromyces finnis]|eukprot:ORX49640.1 hypothetical protein BCR36DRAFT_353280 [Piromyces finnis]